MKYFNNCRFIEKLLIKRFESRQSFKTAFKKPESKPIEISFSKKEEFLFWKEIKKEPWFRT
jgi:hypothetical protein